MNMDMDTNESPTQGISEQKKAVTNRRVPAVTRAVSILRYLANESEPIGIVPLARGVGLIPSTCLHITRVLVNEGLVAVAPQTKQYTLGSGILALASAFSLRNVLKRSAAVCPNSSGISKKLQKMLNTSMYSVLS